MDNCKNTRFSSYNKYNHLLGLCVYRKELESTQVARLSQQVENHIENIQKLIQGKENEIIYDVYDPVSTECHVTFLNPITEGSAKNPRVFELPVAGLNRNINNGFHKIIQTIPNKGIIAIKCFSEDGLGGFLVPHENSRNNLYVMATPNSNEHIELVWSELNGLWFVLNYSGHFENTSSADLGGSIFNIQEPSVATSLVDQDIDNNKIPSAVGWKNRTDTYTIGPSGEYLKKVQEQNQNNTNTTSDTTTNTTSDTTTNTTNNTNNDTTSDTTTNTTSNTTSNTITNAATNTNNNTTTNTNNNTTTNTNNDTTND